MRPLHRVADGQGIVVPPRQPVHVDAAQLPLFQGVLLSVQEAAQLFGAAHVQPQLDQDDPVIDQGLLEARQLAEEGGALRIAGKAEDPFHHAAIVPAAVEQRDLSGGGQPVDIALEIPLPGLAFVGLGQGHDAGRTRVQVLAHAFDGAALAGGVAALEDHDQASARVDHVMHHPHQLQLQLGHMRLVIGSGHLLPIGKVGVEDVLGPGLGQGLADRGGGAGLQIVADLADQRQVRQRGAHGLIPLRCATCHTMSSDRSR